MKTSKKILALVLTMCLVFSIASISASAMQMVFRYEDGLISTWDENGEATYTVNVALSEGSASMNWHGAIKPSTLYNSKIDATSNRYKVTGTFTIPGKTPYSFDFVNAPITGANDREGISTIWFTSMLPFNGAVAKQMLAEAETDEVLRGLLHVEDGVGVICQDNKAFPTINGEVSTVNYTNLSKQNLLKFLGYKANGVEGANTMNYHNANIKVTLKTPYVLNYTVSEDYTVPAGTFFIDENDIVTFPYSWAASNTHYTLGNNNTLVSSAGDGATNLDLSYAVFVAPATGEYEVYAYKRDRADGGSLFGNRDIAIRVNDTLLTFNKKNTPFAASASPNYYWEEDANGTTVTLTKGQRFVIRIDKTTRRYPSCFGFAFVPASDDWDIADMQAANTPKNAASFKTAKYPTYPIATQKIVSNITVNGQTVSVEENCSNDAFPNSRLHDVGGNYIEGVTVLDALFAADANDNQYALTAATWDATNKKLINGNVVNGELQGYAVKVNGHYITNTDQFVLKDGDVISCGPLDIARIAPTGHGPASAAWSDTVAGINGATRKINVGSLTTMNHFVEDYTAENAYANTVVTGYASYTEDQSSSSGDDTLYLNRISIPIVASAMKADGVTLQLGHALESNVVLVNVDGLTYREGLETEGLGKFQETKHLFVAKNDFPEVATISTYKTYNGVSVYADAPVVLSVITTTKNDNGVVVSTELKNVVMDPLEALYIPLAKNQTVYLWRGGQLITGVTAIPLCEPITSDILNAM